MDKNQINNILASVIDVNSDNDLISNKVVKDVIIDNNKLSIAIELNYPAKSYHNELKNTIKDALAKENISNVDIDITTKIISYSVQKGVNVIDGVKNVIAIASGKGGVGKSTTAVNLALALQLEGAKVAVLDADIYGPSQPRMLGVHNQKPDSTAEGRLLPVLGHNMQSMSIGYLVDEQSPMIWRGPMVTQALEQMLRDTIWRGVDYMIIDLPPGTGDTQLTLSQKIPVSGAIIITTPQDIALLDARKGLKMFEKVNVPILGVIENMSLHICSKCGNQEPIFGTDGGKNMAKETGVKFLGALPLDISIRLSSDEGNPTVANDPNGRIANIYRDIAKKMSAKLSAQDKAVAKFPSITIE